MIRKLMIAAAVVVAAGAAIAAPKVTPPPEPAGAQRPGPPQAADFRTPDPENVLVIDTNKGRIIVEMVPTVAPAHVARMRELTREGLYNGLRFFRVIDGFMAQTGDPKNSGEGGSTKPDLAAEFQFRRGVGGDWVKGGDQTVSETGFVGPIPAMSQSSMLIPMTADQKVNAWALYCPGVAAMARASEPDSANSQFFLMRDHYPALERRYTAWGRVISGLEVVRAIKTGEPVADPQDRMDRVRVLADIPAAERPKVRVIDPKGAWFKARLDYARQTDGEDFSPCDIEIPAEVK
jgi:peptidylprolyl isomerase